MKLWFGLLLSVVGGVALLGCSSGGRSGGGRDSGGIMLMGDSGGGGRDGGGGGRDSGGGGGRDSGGGPMCPSDVVPAPAMPGCDAATRTCFMGCMTDMCFTDCINADSTPMDCNACLNQGIISCANSMGCQGAWDEFACCATATCAEDPGCIMMMCSDEDMAYGTCIQDMVPPGGCAGAIGVCFRS
jgi:hypothetical protein